MVAENRICRLVVEVILQGEEVRNKGMVVGMTLREEEAMSNGMGVEEI